MVKIADPLTHCYLCGEPLSGPINRDHCPPIALFAKRIRREYNPSRLTTIPVHAECNARYSDDEQYFQATLAPLARDSLAGGAINEQFLAGTKESERKLSLAYKVLHEFEQRPSGLHLAHGLVAKRFEAHRVVRILWKIARGLYFVEHGAILSESTAVSWTITPPRQPLPETFEFVRDLPDDQTYGRYAGVFDYRFRVFEKEPHKFIYWSFLIWDRIITEVWCHDPQIVFP